MLALPGCAQFPELDATITPAAESAPYPDLVPIATILPDPEADTRLEAEDADRLAARADGLRRRADRLRRHQMAPAPVLR